MTSRARRRSNYEMTLFPFLAVLICTFGALVVLLVVLVQQAKSDAAATVAREAADAAAQQVARTDVAWEELETAAEDAQWQADMLQQAYQGTQNDIAGQRDKLAHLEDHIQRLKDQMRDMVRREENRQPSASSSAELAQLQSELITSTEQLQKLRSELADKQAAAEKRKPSFAILPYRGNQGTSRRPIYVECLADRVILQPEGIELLASDFEPPIGPGNPLAAALRAKSDFWAKVHSQDPGRPYPLLLVRPSGAEAYAACRVALKSWQSEFGYELVPAEMDLAYPESDPQLKSHLEGILKDARMRQQVMRQASAGRHQQLSAGLRPSRNGGFESANPQANSRANGALRSTPPSFARGRASGPGGDGTAGSPNGGAGPWGADSSAGNSAAPGSSPNDTALAGSARGAAGPNSGSGGFGGLGDAGALAAAGQGTGSTSSALQPSTGPSAGSSTGTSAGSSTGSSTGTSTGGDNGQVANGNSAAAGSPPGASGPQRLAANQFGPGGRARSDSANSSNNAAGGSAGSPGAANAGNSSGSTAPGANSSAQAAGGSGPGGTPTPPVNGQMVPMNLDIAPPTNGPRTRRERKAAESMANSRGANWALPQASASAVGIRRPIRVDVQADQLTLRAEAGTREMHRIFPIGESTEKSIEKLVQAIWQRMEFWGPAGQNSYWVPQLVIATADNATELREDLEVLLQDSGLEIRHLEEKQAAEARRRP